MFAKMRKPARTLDEGFTLIELLVVIIIIGILAAIAIPVFLNQRKKGYDAQAKSDLRNAATTEETYLTDNSVYLACSGVSAACVAALAPLGFKPSANATVGIGIDSGNGFCAVSKSTSGNYYVYDSQAGGLQSPSTTPTTFATISFPTTGSCAVSGAKPGTF